MSAAAAATPTAVPPAVMAALRSVPDPEYPGVSIVDLGLLEELRTIGGPDGLVVEVGLIPTFSGCPALTMIADDVRAAIEAVDGVTRCEVEWLTAPVWSTDRIAPSAEGMLRSDFTVVLRGSDGRLRCPVCGSHDVADEALAGPTRCRSIAWCSQCRNVVEVMR